MTKIILFLKGEPFQTIEVDLLRWDKKLSFEINVKLRTFQVDSNIQQLKALYWRQIQKVEFDHYIVVVFESKIGL